MLKSLMFGAAASLTALVALPSAAEAQRYHPGYYGQSYYGGHSGYYPPQAYYGSRYNQRYDRRYDRRYARNYDRRYARNYDRGYYNRRCGSGTTGAIVGGVAGALLGREIDRGGSRYRYRDGTTGAIIGGAAGALVGREVGRSC